MYISGKLAKIHSICFKIDFEMYFFQEMPRRSQQNLVCHTDNIKYSNKIE